MKFTTKKLVSGGHAEMYETYSGGDATPDSHAAMSHSVYVRVSPADGDEWAEHFAEGEEQKAKDLYDSLV